MLHKEKGSLYLFYLCLVTISMYLHEQPKISLTLRQYVQFCADIRRPFLFRNKKIDVPSFLILFFVPSHRLVSNTAVKYRRGLEMTPALNFVEILWTVGLESARLYKITYYLKLYKSEEGCPRQSL